LLSISKYKEIDKIEEAKMEKNKKEIEEKEIVEEVKSINSSFLANFTKPTYTVVEDKAGNIVDYLNVRIEGWASTTKIDRIKDKVLPGAFSKYLPEYLKNPILLLDHARNMKGSIGRVVNIEEHTQGLKIIAEISNAPDVRDVRFKVVEGVFNTLSIGGRFHVRHTGIGRILEQVELREVSIAPIPINADAVFAVKSEKDEKNEEEKKEEIENSAKADTISKEIQEAESLETPIGMDPEALNTDSEIEKSEESKNLYLIDGEDRLKIV
jgi:HK97 family phage prohead protease